MFSSPNLGFLHVSKLKKFNLFLLIGMLSLGTISTALAADSRVTIGIPNTLWVYATDTQGNLLTARVSADTFRTYNGPKGSIKTTNTNRDFPFAASWHLRSSQKWKATLRVIAPPAGYESVNVVCSQTDFNNRNARRLAQTEGTATKANIATVDNLNPGGTTYCQFIFKKIPLNKIPIRHHRY